MTCYYPSTEVAEGLKPCNTTEGAVSACCRIGDVCLTNGYCFSAGQNSLIRRGCTDPNFNSTECPQDCLSGSGNSVDVVMTPCGEYTYFCCGQDDAARSCCTSGNGTVLVAAGTAILPTATMTYSNVVTYSSVITATNTYNSFSSTSSTAPITQNNACNSPQGVSVGAAGGLGAACAVAALMATTFLILWRKKVHQLEVAKERIRDLEPARRMGP